MPTQQKSRTVREAVGVFHSAEELQAAIDELLQSGFHRAEPACSPASRLWTRSSGIVIAR
jgi:hypothetical protein